MRNQAMEKALRSMLVIVLAGGSGTAGRAEEPAPVAEGAAGAAAATGKEASKTQAKGTEAGASSAAGAAKDAARGEDRGHRALTAPPIFRLRDNTRIAGFPQVGTINVETAYGRLVVPVNELVRIRFAPEKDSNLEAQVKAQIARLGSDDFDTREDAMNKLRELGASAQKYLTEATSSEDEEVKTRAGALLTEMKEGGDEDASDDDSAALTGDDDEVVTSRFTIRGKIQERRYRVKSPYGELTVEPRNIVSIVFQEVSPSTADVSVPATHFAPANNWLETKLNVDKGERLEITAKGQIQLHNYGWTVGPEGTTNIGGTQFENFPQASLVARIGKKGKPFLIGQSYKGEANASGKLMFGIAFQRGQVSGAFEVKVDVKHAEGGK